MANAINVSNFAGLTMRDRAGGGKELALTTGDGQAMYISVYNSSGTKLYEWKILDENGSVIMPWSTNYGSGSSKELKVVLTQENKWQ